MKILIWFLFFTFPMLTLAQTQDLQNKSILASQYYQSKDFGKAAELYEQLYDATKSEGYFNIYLDCLLGIPDYNKAEKAIRKGIRGNSADSYWYVQWGFVKKALGQDAESRRLYDKALAAVEDNPSAYPNLANQFVGRREFEYAEKVYLKGRASGNPNQYNYELARIYYYMRNYERMLNEYLEWIKLKDTNLDIVKSNLQSVLSMDNDHEISRQMKNYLIKRIQDEPNQIIYNRLLIWLFIQDKNFTAAIRQLISLDKRTGMEDANIYAIAGITASNEYFDEAAKAYDYIIAKGKKSEYFAKAHVDRLQMQYNRFIKEDMIDLNKASILKEQFLQIFSIIGIIPESSIFKPEYANLLAFYLKQPDDAIQSLTNALALPGLNVQQVSLLKAELSDVYVYSGDLWEAVLSYSQTIENDKSTQIGDDMKLKRAKLGYYMGNFKWAKAQLDVLRASTSKLIANDSMGLAIFISQNLENDTVVSVPLQIFARADLHLFRNNFDEAIAALDSVSTLYPDNSLIDDVSYRKAQIFQKQGRFNEAGTLYGSIVQNHSWEMLADDALYQLARLNQNKLNNKVEAMNMYKKMLTDYPGSVYVVDSREEYRRLQDGKDNPTNKVEN